MLVCILIQPQVFFMEGEHIESHLKRRKEDVALRHSHELLSREIGILIFLHISRYNGKVNSKGGVNHAIYNIYNIS